MPIDVTQIMNYFSSSTPSAYNLMMYFMPLLYVSVALYLGTRALFFFYNLIINGINSLIHHHPEGKMAGLRHEARHKVMDDIQNNADFELWQRAHGYRK